MLTPRLVTNGIPRPLPPSIAFKHRNPNQSDQARAKPAARSSPAQLPQCHTGMPYLRQMADFVVSELHDVDVVRSRLFAGRLTRAAGTGMSTREDSVGSNVVSF